MGPPSGAGDDPLQLRDRQHEIVADLGRRALDGDDPDWLMHDAAAEVAEALAADYVGVFELTPDDHRLELREGVGWREEEGPVGDPAEPQHLGGRVLAEAEPVVFGEAGRAVPRSDRLVRHDVTSGIAVPLTPGGEARGLLGVYTRERRTFTDGDVAFLQSVANVLAAALETEGRAVLQDGSQQRRPEAEFEEMIDRVTDAFYALDEEFRFKHVNEAATRFLQHSEEELIGENLWDLFPEAAEIDEVWDAFHRALEEQETTGYDLYYPPLDLWVDATIYPSQSGVSVYFRDVTERKQRERELRESEAKFRTLAENLSEIVWMSSEDPQEFLYINPAFEEVWGIDREQLYEEPLVFLEKVHPEDRERVREAYTSSPGEYDETYRVVQPEGDVRWVHARAVPVRDDEGEVFRIVGIADDITERREFQARLADSERRHRTLVENFPNGAVAMFDEELRYTIAGGTLMEEMGLSSEEIVGQSIRERLPAEVLDVAEPRFQSALDGETSRFEIDHHGRHLLAHTIPVRDARGEVTAGMLVVQDITEQKDREQRLRETKSQLEAATEAGAVGTWEWHVPEDRLVTGRAMAQLFDIDPERARRGVPLDDLFTSIHEDDQDRIGRAVEEALDTCGTYEQEYRVWDADGDLRWVVARGQVECDDEGNPVTFPGALTDITERKRAEIERERTKDQLESLFAILPVGVVVGEETDQPGGQVVEANQTAREMLPDAILEGTWATDASKVEIAWANSGEPVEPEAWTMARIFQGEAIGDPDVFAVTDADGDRRVLMVDGARIRRRGAHVPRAVITMTDITERREYQRRLEESNRRLEQFAYAASHDLQEPLRMVSTYLQLIESRYGEHLDEEGREFFAYAVDGAKRMREMIKSLLAYSRIKTGGRPLEPIESRTVFEDVLGDLRLRIEETDAEVTAGDLPRVQADPDQLGQVFRNLLTNALKYSGDDPPRIHVDAEPEGEMWRFSVRDEGIGIAPEHTERIFEVFRRLDDRGAGEGTGIGLAICEQIVDRHGGRMSVESKPGEGSTFYFTMPAV